MDCTRCEKNKASIRLDFQNIDTRESIMHGNLCQQCSEEVVNLLYSCTCHIKEDKDAIHTS